MEMYEIFFGYQGKVTYQEPQVSLHEGILQGPRCKQVRSQDFVCETQVVQSQVVQ